MSALRMTNSVFHIWSIIYFSLVLSVYWSRFYWNLYYIKKKKTKYDLYQFEVIQPSSWSADVSGLYNDHKGVTSTQTLETSSEG